MNEDEEAKETEALIAKVTANEFEAREVEGFLGRLADSIGVECDLEFRTKTLSQMMVVQQRLEAIERPGRMLIDRIQSVSPVIRGLAMDIILIQGASKSLSDSKLLLRFLEKSLCRDRKAEKLLTAAKELAAEWQREPSFRAGTNRAFRLSVIWAELGNPPSITRDELWAIFCKRHPELLDDVLDERKAKSSAFKDARLSFLKINKGGKPLR